MNTNGIGWKSFEHEWIPFHKTDIYKSLKRNKKNHIINMEDIKMEVELHNHSSIEYEKSMKSVSFIAKSLFKKFSTRKKWKLEVWLDESDANDSPEISCGVALKRPRRSTIYAKRFAGSLNEAIKQSVKSVENSIKKEKRWKNQNQLKIAG